MNKALQPSLIELADSIHLAGLSTVTDNYMVFRDVPALNRKFQKLKQSNPIPNLSNPWNFAAISRSYNPDDGSWIYFIGDAVKSYTALPDYYDRFTIPLGKYAVFPSHTFLHLFWSIYLPRLKQRIYREWLPDSGYISAHHIDDFELHDIRSKRGLFPVIDIYIPLSREN